MAGMCEQNCTDKWSVLLMSSFWPVKCQEKSARWIALTEQMRVLDVRNCLGEGLLWDPQRELIWWVDIQASQILSCGLEADTELRVWQLSTRPTALALIDDGCILVGAERGILVFDPEKEKITPRVSFGTLPAGVRMNDGGTDCRGLFWLGSMNEHPTGAMGQIYCLSHSGIFETCIADIGISNGIVATEDGRGLYVADSRAGVISLWDTDVVSGQPIRSRVFCDGTRVPGVPDGATLDSERHLWSARWGGWCVVRYTPDGQVDKIVKLPVEQPTNCTFAGPHYQTLLVSSAWDGLDGAALEGQPYAGGLFAIDTPFVGTAPQPFHAAERGGSA